MSPSKISRIETGNSGLQLEDVAALLGLYQVPTAVRDDLLDLVRRSEERGWWTHQPGLPQLWRSFIDFEAKANRIQNYEALVVPGGRRPWRHRRRTRLEKPGWQRAGRPPPAWTAVTTALRADKFS